MDRPKREKYLPKKLSDNAIRFQCSYCNSNYARKASLNTHVKQKHQENDIVNDKEVSPQQIVIEKKVNKIAKNGMKDSKVIVDKKINDNFKGSDDENQLEHDEKEVHLEKEPENEKLFKCETCYKCFKCKDNYNLHLQIHNEKKYRK